MATPKISLVLADVDGTLVDSQKVVTPRAQAAIQRLRERGIETSAHGPECIVHHGDTGIAKYRYDEDGVRCMYRGRRQAPPELVDDFIATSFEVFRDHALRVASIIEWRRVCERANTLPPIL